MAAEVPVSDVLCEAMEYLSKLGSNLRTRSENLKEKRISKEKLKNSHAIQKAASKVLLICELSKKSLDNVEAGVRKVMSLIEKSQAPVGGKKVDITTGESKHKYHYFEYQSRKLRIAKKVHLKHYMSVKVLARGMPVSMQEKYPVYYDCKLKRHRRKIAAKIRSEIHKDSDNKIPIDSDNELPVETGEVLECTEEKVLDIDQKSPRPNNKCTDSDQELSVIEKDTSNKSVDKIGNKDQDKCDTDPSDNVEENVVRMSKKHQRRHSKRDKESPKKKKSGRIRVADIYSSDSNEELEHNHDTELPPCPKNKDDCLSDNSNHEPNVKKPKLITSDNSRSQSESDLRSNKLKIDVEFSEKHDSDNDSTLSKQGTQNESGEESKPVIRCVNLSKLLKPDVLCKSNGQQTNHKKVRRKEENNDDEYWTQKRKEVRLFKPKNFSINIARLPTLSVAFLLSNNLKKITKGGNIICTVSNESDTPNSKKMKAVKNALLNDSESDECREAHDAMKVKKSLLKDSDSEHKISEEEHVEKPDDNEKKDKNSSGKEKTKKKKKSKESKTVTDNIHSDLDSATNNDSQEDNCNESLERIHEGQNQKTNEECNVQSNEIDPVTSTKSNETVKAALLNDLSDEDLAGFRKNDSSEVSTQNENNDNLCDKNQSNGVDPQTPSNINQAVKSSLLNDSSDDDATELSKHDKCSEIPSEINSSKDEGENHSVDDQRIPTSNEIELETPTKLDEHTKSSLLNTSPDDPFAGFSKKDVEESTKTNEKIKNALLNDSSDENSNKNEEESPTKVNQKVKSALLNDSSDVKSDSFVNQKQRQKTPKSKRKKDRKSREAKQKLRYSSSDSEQEKPKRRSRKKARSSSSSSSEDIKQKKSKTKKLKIDSDSSDSNNKTIDQVDGAIDENSSSSMKKMVRSKAKPSGSSSQNSDNQDASDKDIDGLTNLSNLNKNRRHETSTRNRQAGKSSSRAKDTPTIGEDLLKAESSSDASEADVNDDNEIAQDLPEVTLAGLNGDHMAKDDLLGDSDSSVSHHDKDGSENPENSEEENVKSIRRKANAISSDSDGGSNRRKAKQEDDRMSDFEDSEAESSEPGKKAKRKKKNSDSDASVDSNDGKKKRKRIKVVNDSEEGSGSDTENEGRNKHGRKNIRKVMGKNQLEEATKKAAREEKERIARITERQKLYNNLDFDESGKPDEVVLEKVVLDFDPETKEPLIQVDRGLVKKLKPHQANGIKFMWDACFESVKRIKKDKGSGCILAHCMGLGKTLQVISLTHTLLVHGDLTGVNRVLVVCPLSTVLNWVNEIRMWLKHAVTDFEVDVYELSRYKQNSERAFQLQQWFDGGGVCVLGYEMFRNLSADNNKKFKKKMLKSFQESLVDPGPDLVVCDEGHLLKNEKTSLSQSMNRVRTLRRIVLTGTPLQNNLKEYYCMVQFVKPNLLGKYNEYLNRFVNPITNGQYTDSTEHDIRVMKRRSHVLHKMLDGAVQRRDYGVLAPFLPPKHEYVLFITLTEVQVKLYQYYLDNYSRRPLAGKSSGFLFPDFQSLQRIWTHPLVLKYNSERYEIMQQKKRDKEEEDSEGSLVDFIDDDSTPDESTTEESTDDSSDLSDDSRKKSKKNKKSSKKGKGKDSKGSTRRGTRANPTLVDVDDEDNGADDVIEVKNENPTEWWIKLVEESELEDMRNSHKLVLLFDILRQCETIGDKLLVFSQSLYSLDLIEHFLGKVDEATQEGRIDEKLGGHVGSWSPGVDYFRLDGSTSCENRSIWCKNFNREDNPRARLFLISTRAGGLGINLVAANRVVIFDVSWNPSHDVQSIFRVYRFGQKKPCYVYRFLAMGTMEEKIYERQVTKQAISKRVIDEQQIDRHYAENDLAELYKFEAAPHEPRPLPTLPKDRLFAEMLKEHEAQIYKYHEHDSLLENKEEETLSEEERKAAWEDFENEKSRPPPAPFANAWPLHNGMVPGLLAQQQQQLAYAALAAMLRKDMPNINDNQIRDMLPLIYNSNPQLMQKMGEIYKYAQPGMMNPGMMNPVMNSGGSGGASGLQYEPPWQRQHQQQQQMRLQQLMQQQQNQMGAKFYAGGLGSRDPIAMALQQQRAREMLMGGAASGAAGAGAGRPRGRPPLRPPTTSQDVVNLDSD